MSLSRRDIYSPLDFLPGRLELDESSRIRWGISARSECWKRGRDVGAGRNVEEFQSSPFKRSQLRLTLAPLSLHLSLSLSVELALLAPNERPLLPKHQDTTLFWKWLVSCECLSLPQYPFSFYPPPWPPLLWQGVWFIFKLDVYKFGTKL